MRTIIQSYHWFFHTNKEHKNPLQDGHVPNTHQTRIVGVWTEIGMERGDSPARQIAPRYNAVRLLHLKAQAAQNPANWGGRRKEIVNKCQQIPLPRPLLMPLYIQRVLGYMICLN